MSDRDRDGGLRFLLAFVLGAAAGAAVTYLTAPQSGRETRRRLKEWAEKGGAGAERILPALDRVAERASEAARAARDAWKADPRTR